MTARFYDELAPWWPLFSPPENYGVEADDLLPRLGSRPRSETATMLELGSGGGSLAYHLKHHFRLTLTDRSSGMVAVNRAVNPECEHILGDMRTLRLDRTFDVVLIHDAIMYATGVEDVLATLGTAARHCRTDGIVAVLPDCVKETFTPGTEHGGKDGPDGRGLRYLEWRWDPDPSDTTFIVDYAFLLREADGVVSVFHDRHIEGVFHRAQWIQWFTEVGLSAHADRDPWNRDVFIATPTTP